MKIFEDILTMTASEFNATSLFKYDEVPFPAGNQGTRKRKRYLNCVCAFDIETSRLADIDQSFMYIWQFCVNAEYVVYGRTWGEYLEMLKRIKSVLGDLNLIIYVHNLSYEFQFLKGIYDFEQSDVFAINTRKIAKCYMLGCFEYRCSAIHSGSSLKKFCKDWKADHLKLSGDDFNYEKVRYPWDPLDDEELLYCFHDVMGLCEALKNEMAHDGDTLRTIPMTITGYVRREVKVVMRQAWHYLYIQKILPDYETYRLLRDGFRGGNTHANRFYVRKKIKGVQVLDLSSAYPAAQICDRFPVGPWKELRGVTMDTLFELSADDYAYMICFSVTDIKLKDPYNGAPYIPFSKCKGLSNEIRDNGRILRADTLTHTCTDIDFYIILDQYEFKNFKVHECRYSAYGYLPRSLKNLIQEYYNKKTSLKHVDGHDAELTYMRAKAQLNSVYGMSATDPLQSETIYDPETRELNEKEKEDPEAAYEKYRKGAFFPYSWGVWTTAHTRRRLQMAIDHVGVDRFVYCDTDAVYFLGEADFTDINREAKEDAFDNGAFADDAAGERHYMGVFEFDKYCKEFKTLGAKKYVYTDNDDKLHITIAGVVKGEKGEAVECLGSIDNFKEGFIFTGKAGGLEAVYNDNITRVIHREGHELIITDNVCLRPSTYTLGLSADYERLLSSLDLFGVDVVDY